MIENLLDWFGPLFSADLSYALIGAVVLLDRGAFIGLVAPGDLFLALGGVFAARGSLSLPLVIVTGFASGVVGESISYWLGRRFGIRVVRRLPFRERMEKNLERSEEYFRSHGRRAVFVARYVSVVGTFLPFVAGASKMPFVRFIVADVAAMIMWAAGVSALGYFLSAQVELVDRILSRFTWGLLALIVVVVAARTAWRRRDDVRRLIRPVKS